jgi:hypothetical protein
MVRVTKVWLIFFCGIAILFFAPIASHATQAGDLGEFLKLHEKLPQAVCDESTVSRAPSLAISNIDAPELVIQAQVDESTLIRFLLGDSFALVASPHLQALSAQAVAPKLSQLKRQVSLELCTALITPGRLGKVFAASPSWLFSGVPVLALANKRRVPEHLATIRVQDIDGRFGYVGRKWWVPGWVEPYEVLSARIGKREYVRLANPVTNRMQFIEVMGSNGIPLGFVYPTEEEITSLDWKSQKTKAATEPARQKAIDIYRLMIEIDAYHALTRSRGKADGIRKLQDFYKNLLAAYQIYPEEAQFALFAQKIGRMIGDDELKKTLDEVFFAAVSKARVNSAQVRFQLLQPDVKLHGMYLEYLERLKRLGR